MQLSAKELSYMQDTDFLLTKVVVLKRVRSHLEATRAQLELMIEEAGFSFPAGIPKSGKISKGENYQSLPYMVLDFPAYFNREDIFAFRTMFWWGHFFSFTLHLQGTYLDDLKGGIWKNRGELIGQDIFIGVGDSPWQYHYEPDNYLPYDQAHEDVLIGSKFLKLSKKISLEDWDNLPGEAANFLKLLMAIM